ncbi:MAG: hypothetical protein GY679_00160 [Mycoplasma sp.]|nr:hypothetical protein [Mycoplasma sp.]
MTKSKPEPVVKEEEISAKDSATHKAKKDKITLRRKGIVSPDLSKMKKVKITKGYKFIKHE